jgi:tetrahedral aminopeptidase
MAELKQILLELSETMSISGFENRSADKLCKLISPYFDEYVRSQNGNQIFIKHSKKENAPRLLIDAHLDEIGMMVTEIKEGGFIRVTNIGGVDTRILLAGEVIIYGSEPVYGVVCVTPPHLQKPGENTKLPPVNELFIDTGFTPDILATKGVALGTPVGFKPVNTELLGGLIA